MKQKKLPDREMVRELFCFYINCTNYSINSYLFIIFASE